ncbi:MAG: amino acid permease [Candidatus Aenigmarchaeota archaeon]|nr:amino acid permease [Candidatus Aenigmarchaeota archaeon]
MSGLRRVIGFPLLLLLTINALIGSGIFFHPGIAAGFAGPASIIAWIAVSLLALLMAGFFGELVSTWPRAGGVYEYAKHALSEPSAFLVGWLGWLTASVTIGTELVGGLLYLFPSAPLYVNIGLAFSLLTIFSLIAVRGIKLSAALLLAFGIISLLVVIVVGLAGMTAINIVNYSPFFVSGITGIALAAFFVAEMFFGWEGVTYLAEEVNDPRKALPKALLISTCILAIMGTGIATISLGVLPSKTLASSNAPLAAVASVAMPGMGAIVGMLAAVAIIGTAASWIVFAPRLLFAMARDNLFVHGIQKLHPRWQTPYKAIALQVLVISIVILLCAGNLQVMFGLLIPMYVLLYILFLVCFVRLSSLTAKREFIAPLRTVGPYIAALFLLGMLFVWLGTPSAHLSFAAVLTLLFAGFPAYVAVRLQTDQAFVEKFWNRMGVALDLYIPLLLFGQWRHVLAMADVKKDHTVLDYGCGAGWLTKRLATRVRRVVSADIAEKQLSKALAMMNRAELENVILVKTSRPAPFPANSFDRIICTIAINYFVSPEKELTALAKTLKRGGKALFLAVRAPGLTLQPFLRQDSSIKAAFKAAGFKKINIDRVCTFGREYIYISTTK